MTYYTPYYNHAEDRIALTRFNSTSIRVLELESRIRVLDLEW